MSYVKNTLFPQEQILYFTKSHYMIFGMATILIILTIVINIASANRIYKSLALFVSGTHCLDIALRYFGAEYAVTDKRILMKTGLISRQSLELPFKRIETIYVAQGLVGRWLNFGTVVVSGIGGTKNRFTYIPDPHKFRTLIQQRLDLV